MRRPLSPHLQVYKLQFTSGLSIFHRISGVCLIAFMMLGFAYIALAYFDKTMFIRIQKYAGGWVYQVYWWKFHTFFSYHLFNGIRHIYWDLGKGYHIDFVEKSANIILLLTMISSFIGAVYIFDPSQWRLFS